MNEEESNLLDRLAEQPVVRFESGYWQSIEDRLEEVERHRTHISGDLVIVRLGSGYAAVEEPSSRERVLRWLADMGEVRSFVTDRLETYERMWDGCGCKIDYYG